MSCDKSIEILRGEMFGVLRKIKDDVSKNPKPETLEVNLIIFDEFIIKTCEKYKHIQKLADDLIFYKKHRDFLARAYDNMVYELDNSKID